MELSARLAKHLRSVDGHLGRAGKEIGLLAKKTKLSVAMLQSVAMGRRTCSDRAAKRLGFWLTRAEADHAELRRVR